MAALYAYVPEDVYKAIVKEFTEEESNAVTKKKKWSAKKVRWGSMLDCSSRLTIPYIIPLKKVVYQQNGGENCFIVTFLTMLQMAGFGKKVMIWS
jgi:hypothetical protein